MPERSFASVELDIDPDPPAPPPSGVGRREDKVAAMRELYAAGDADGALLIASTISRSTLPPEVQEGGGLDVTVPIPVDVSVPIPIDVSLAPDFLSPPPQPRVVLTLRTVPRVVKSPSEISRLPIDHRGGFLLTCIDGVQTLDEVLDVCAMPPREALELIRSLALLGVIELAARRHRG